MTSAHDNHPEGGVNPEVPDNRAPWRKPECVRLATSDTEAATPVGTLTDGTATMYSSVTAPPVS